MITSTSAEITKATTIMTTQSTNTTTTLATNMPMVTPPKESNGRTTWSR